MIARREWKPLAAIGLLFLVFYWLPVGAPRFDRSLLEALALAREYARQHVLLCLVPAFFIAGAIAVFLSQEAVLRTLGPRANKLLAYGVASVSGSILAVCSCTVLPLFAGIHRRGAGLGPATTFLYAGPAINILAIILTARILGVELGVARAIGAIGFSVVIGLIMQAVFPADPDGSEESGFPSADPDGSRPLYQDALTIAAMVGVLVFANWGSPAGEPGLWGAVASARWVLTAVFALGLGAALVAWRGLRIGRAILAAACVASLALLFPETPAVAFAAGILALAGLVATGTGELQEWLSSTWDLAKQILPLLLLGVLVAGALFGRPGHEGLVPSAWVQQAVGGNSIRANLFASVAGAFMYFATLTEVPILQGLISSGMGKGPALALLLAGPALSLPNMLVIRSVIGTKKTLVFVALVIVAAATSGMIYGTLL
ncbi:MAG: hypothetical protein GF346_12740 [Candidatus Eisenbacteria bacterium]|nr:hypothetical protein [Candidatus Latescibacterota bacterium]MBD3303304.1 hypothetical protein [Candidatus Eisenbacteria bacterium]